MTLLHASQLVSLASGVHPELAPEEMARVAGEAGYEGVGLWVEPGKNWPAGTTARVRNQLEAHHLIPLDVEVIWLQPGAKPDPVHHRIIEIGAELGARNCLIVSSEPDITNTKRLYQDLCEKADAAGMRACLEFMLITELRTLAQAMEVVEDVGHPAGGILIDSFHLERTGLTPAAVAAVPTKWLTYVQLCDVPGRGKLTDHDKYLEDALDGRLAPGEGVLPLEELMNHLPESIPVSLEVRSKCYRDTYPDPVERAKAILQWARRRT